MMKRVCNTRVGACAMLLAVFLLVGGAGAPVFARVDVSVGQAGDPGDGEEVASGGGSDIPSPQSTNQIPAGTAQQPAKVILVPVFSNGALAFQLFAISVLYVVRH
jgi:hypothetical protein